MRFTGNFLGRIVGKGVKAVPQNTQYITKVRRGVHKGSLRCWSFCPWQGRTDECGLRRWIWRETETNFSPFTGDISSNIASSLLVLPGLFWSVFSFCFHWQLPRLTPAPGGGGWAGQGWRPQHWGWGGHRRLCWHRRAAPFHQPHCPHVRGAD